MARQSKAKDAPSLEAKPIRTVLIGHGKRSDAGFPVSGPVYAKGNLMVTHGYEIQIVVPLPSFGRISYAMVIDPNRRMITKTLFHNRDDFLRALESVILGAYHMAEPAILAAIERTPMLAKKGNPTVGYAGTSAWPDPK